LNISSWACWTSRRTGKATVSSLGKEIPFGRIPPKERREDNVETVPDSWKYASYLGSLIIQVKEMENSDPDTTDLQISRMIQRAIMSFNDSVDFNVVSQLLREGPKPFSELREGFDNSNTELRRRLLRLMEGALIVNFFAKRSGDRKYSFYEATDLAEDLFEKMYELQAISPPIQILNNPFYDLGPEIEWTNVETPVPRRRSTVRVVHEREG